MRVNGDGEGGSYLIGDASWQDGLDDNASGFPAHDAEAQASAVVDQLNGLHVLPLLYEGERQWETVRERGRGERDREREGERAHWAHPLQGV